MFVVVYDYAWEGYGPPVFCSENLDDCKAYVEKKNSEFAWDCQEVNWTEKDTILYLDDPNKGKYLYCGWVVFKI